MGFDNIDYRDEGCREICAPQEEAAAQDLIDRALYYGVLTIAFIVFALMAWPH